MTTAKLTIQYKDFVYTPWIGCYGILFAYRKLFDWLNNRPLNEPGHTTNIMDTDEEVNASAQAVSEEHSSSESEVSCSESEYRRKFAETIATDRKGAKETIEEVVNRYGKAPFLEWSSLAVEDIDLLEHCDLRIFGDWAALPNETLTALISARPLQLGFMFFVELLKEEIIALPGSWKIYSPIYMAAADTTELSLIVE